jgi:hypothetical protein
MKNKMLMPYLLFAICIMINSTLISQTCLPDGITFYSQADVANFSLNYPDCNSIAGNVKIQGNIDFTGLEQITTIEGGIICNECSGFENFQGLNNLTSLGFLSWDEGAAFSFSGLESLVHVVEGISLDEANFDSFAGMSALETVGGDFTISECRFDAFNGPVLLESIGGSLILQETSDLTSINSLSNLVSIGDGLVIDENDDLVAIMGLSQVSFLGGELHVTDNPVLASLSGLDLITSIGGDLFIEECHLLENLNGLDGIISMAGAISISENDNITDILGIAQINPESITELQINLCPQLSFCSVASVCGFLNISTELSLFGENLADCNTSDEILANCEVNSITEEDNAVFSLMTNQVVNELVIQYNKNHAFMILDSMGRVVMEFTHTGTPIDVSVLSAGFYFVRVEGVEGKALRFQKM